MVGRSRSQPVGAPNARFQGRIPEFYDRHLVPFLFDPYARELARRLQVGPNGRVLELACGTGAATRLLRAALPAGAQLVATDLNPAMLDVARRNLAAADVHWRTADASELPFKDGAFDAVVVQFGLMFLPDRAKGFHEAKRVLAAGGTLLASVWLPLADNPAAEVVHQVAAELAPADPPQFLRTPYGSMDAEAMRGFAAAAGFSRVEVERVDVMGIAPSARAVADGFAKGTPLSLELAERGIDLDVAAAAMLPPLAKHGGNPFRSPLAAYVLTAT
jgi:SAM-dependent methyltransferase